MYINWVVSDDLYFSFRQPSDNSHFRQPSEPFSLDSSHALTPIFLVFQCIWNACMPIPIQSNSHVNI